ncbi:hypothetical protein BN159_7572 [Streptomyces davaonensis JCM 4913]|uniref:Uncharacterized protein n=1 Tax=Streptomyces davaonensis (strain DSM 101723 / JCM 4913 / KCC S-0913 / 768) TaxID=1214101 RepID=K4R6R7_STRDJ|nr:hypothetical protein [Streptomyces davaonensis]CCK31951.1 hypothetical protein BN159_7572 [Streptomyces davaonensis JCM 4913]
MSDAEGTPVPDFLDRLLARHAPAAAPRPDVARLRPRLPGPFERVEAVRGTAQEPDETTPAVALWPTAAPQHDAPGRTEVRLRTERERTVVRTEHTVEERELSPTPVPLTAPLLRPAAPVAPRAVPEPARRAPAARGRQERSPDKGPATVPAGREAPSTAPVPTPLRPTAADTAAARDAVRQAAARRPSRQPEQVVQVQIGRLEVTAGPAPSGGTRQRSPEHSRPGATLSLADYLARGRE